MDEKETDGKIICGQQREKWRGEWVRRACESNGWREGEGQQGDWMGKMDKEKELGRGKRTYMKRWRTVIGGGRLSKYERIGIGKRTDIRRQEEREANSTLPGCCSLQDFLVLLVLLLLDLLALFLLVLLLVLVFLKINFH